MLAGRLRISWSGELNQIRLGVTLLSNHPESKYIEIRPEVGSNEKKGGFTPGAAGKANFIAVNEISEASLRSERKRLKSNIPLLASSAVILTKDWKGVLL